MQGRAAQHVVDLGTHAADGAHRLVIWVPLVQALAGGFPVPWVPDGNGYGAMAVDMVRNRRVFAAEIDAAVVVVGDADGRFATWTSRRFFDFTPPDLPAGRGREGPRHGGLETFLDLRAGPALPAVAERVATARGRLAIFGHSIGDLAGLR